MSDFKAHASQVFSSVHEHGRSVVITQNGKLAAVLISPEEFDRYQEREDFVAAVSEGRNDAKHGRIHAIKDVKAMLDKKIWQDEMKIAFSSRALSDLETLETLKPIHLLDGRRCGSMYFYTRK